MKRLTLTTALAAALLSPQVTASALSTKSYDFCGGSYSGFTGLAFCASVVVSVTAAPAIDSWGIAHAPGAYTVAMQIMNLSGTNGSYAGSLFAQVGLDNLLGPIALANPADIIITQDGAIVCKNLTNSQQGNAKCYGVSLNSTAAGGVRVDFLASTSNGVNKSIASGCSGALNYLYTCGADGNPTNNKPVTIQFDVTSNLDLTSAEYYVKAQGQLGSTECETGNVYPNIACVPPPTTSTPEPATLALLGTGLSALGVPSFIRRRRKKTAEAEQI